MFKRTYIKSLMIGTALATTAVMQPVNADQVFNDDLIVRGDACVGDDCVDGEVFDDPPDIPGFPRNELKIKDSRVRLRFEDTSFTAGVPTNDWQILINDVTVGGADFFAIQDIDSDTIPFRVDAGALDNALRIDKSSRVGLGTATPAANLHIKDGDTPDIAFEQDGSGGFTPQTWGIGGNHTGFGISDITGGDTIPFAVATGAGDGSFRIEADNRVAIGIPLGDSADAPLEVKPLGGNIGLGNAAIKLANPAGPVAFQLNPFEDANFWNFSAFSNTEFRVSRSGTGQAEMKLTSAGDLTITGSIFTAGGTCGGGCDRVFDADYELASIEEHASEMWKKKHLPNVGPTIENQPINLSDKTGRMLNELEMAHIYIAQLNNEKKVMKAEIDELNLRLSRLEEILSQ